MKKSQLPAWTFLATTAVIAGTTIWLLRKRQHKKRREFVANAGYELAYDVHFPPKYKGESRRGRNFNIS
jgi:hypothetical protein